MVSITQYMLLKNVLQVVVAHDVSYTVQLSAALLVLCDMVSVTAVSQSQSEGQHLH